jgi:predicted DCC family thiol-disulfide oxidoreductase YuxK
MSALDLAMQARLFALLLGVVVLLALFEQAVRRLVVSDVVFRLWRVLGVFWRGAVAGMELF